MTRRSDVSRLTWGDLADQGLSIISNSDDLRSMTGTWVLIGNDNIVYAESDDLFEVIDVARQMMGRA